MSLHTLHLLLSYVFWCLGTYSLWLGESEGTFAYPWVVTFLAICGFIATDLKRAFRLPLLASNGLGLVILIATTLEFFRGSSTHLLILAHFGVYVQVVKFFREKTETDLWQLHLLNLLQVVVGCVINASLSFGLLLASYVTLGAVVLNLFYHDRRRLDFVSSEPKRDPQSGLLSRRDLFALARPLSATCLVAIPIALAAFWLIPRPSAAGLGGDALSASMRNPVTGFAPSVRLDELGKVMERSRVVFRVKPQGDFRENTAFSGETLWRGMVFTTYRQKGWHVSNLSRTIARQPQSWRQLSKPPNDQILLDVVQELDTGTIAFAPAPIRGALLKGEDGWVECLRLEERLELAGNAVRRLMPGRRRHYQIITDASISPAPAIPSDPPPGNYLNQTTRKPRDLPRLAALADDLCKSIDAADARGKMEAIRAHLVNPSEFTYTVNIASQDPDVDPIEDFLFTRKSGHCEYFATAMALMLRQVGVASRLVNGFKGAEYDADSNEYLVREMYAHSWVEAYDPAAKQWVTIDPTPGAGRDEQLAHTLSTYNPIKRFFESSERWWNENVLGFNDETQREFVRATRNWGRSLLALVTGVDPSAWEIEAPDWIGIALQIAPRAILVFLTVFVLAVWIKRRRSRARRSKGSNGRADCLQPYRRWVEMMDKAGHRRAESQTPLEFARSIEADWRADPELAGWSELPRHLTESYYQIRYGGQTLDPNEIANYDQSLDLLAAPLVAHGSNGSGRLAV